ncbi:MAG: OmpA family protein, partial [Candidatus Krumholzibacteria bacterium]|nr:OmpA family protein [Candidatus Krumholzibacteria bacterium]
MRTRLLIPLLLIVVVGMIATGCSNKKLIEQKDAQISALQDELDSLEGQLSDEKSRTARLQSDLDNSLADMRTKEQVWMQEKEGMTQITLDGEVTFASGSTRLTPEGQDILTRIWDVLQNYASRDILIEGHTDNVQISPQFQHRYRSNWELSSARANSVLHYVLDKYGTDAGRVCAVGYGEYRPIASNDSEEGKRM